MTMTLDEARRWVRSMSDTPGTLIGLTGVHWTAGQPRCMLSGEFEANQLRALAEHMDSRRIGLIYEKPWHAEARKLVANGCSASAVARMLGVSGTAVKYATNPDFAARERRRQAEYYAKKAVGK